MAIVGLMLGNLWRTGAIALCLAMTIVIWRADAISGQRDAAREALANARAAHAITRASLADAETALARQSAAVESMQRAGEESARRAEKALSEALAANKDVDRSITRVKARRLVDCETGREVMEAGL